MIKDSRFGIGTDIEDIQRFKNIDRVKNILFLNRLFTGNEIDYCFSRINTASHLAVRYAGKEAVIKALSCFGQSKRLSLKKIEIINNKAGIPQVKINSKETKSLHIQISLSHSQNLAVAFVVVSSKII